MAIWQYSIHLVPNEEVASRDAVEDVDWWKYRQLDKNGVEVFAPLLPKTKSWCKEIIQFGDLESNCIEFMEEDNRIVSVQARFDLRIDYRPFISLLVAYADENNCCFIDSECNVIPASYEPLLDAVRKYPSFRDFLEMLK